MFYVVDLISGFELPFDSKRAVLSYWRWTIQRESSGYPELVSEFDFSELNVTGRDTFYGRTLVPIQCEPPHPKGRGFLFAEISAC